MDTAFGLLLTVHLGALVVGGATNVAMPLIARQMVQASPDALGRLAPIAGQLSRNGRWALGVLVLTGILMLWLRYDGDASGLGPWFIAKLVFVAAILAALFLPLVTRPGLLSPRLFGRLTRFALIGIVVCSVMTFG